VDQSFVLLPVKVKREEMGAGKIVLIVLALQIKKTM